MRSIKIREQNGRHKSNNLNNYVIYKWITHTNKRRRPVRVVHKNKYSEYALYKTHFIDLKIQTGCK